MKRNCEGGGSHEWSYNTDGYRQCIACGHQQYRIANEWQDDEE
jgi:Zn ribbon nucleic-acid-binding protein